MPTLSIETPKQRPIVWQPLKNSSQEFAMDTRAQITLYTGTRGPGKTDAQLMRFRRHVGVGYGPFWRGIIFDREYKNLDDLVSKSKRWFYRFDDGAQFLSSPSVYKWVWPTGEELLFRQIKILDDYNNYHGQEYPFIGWNELTKYKNADLFEMMMSCNRSSWTQEKDSERDADGQFLTLPIPHEVFATTNSRGPGHHWVKDRFIDAAPYGKIVRVPINIFNPRTQQREVHMRTQVSIFGSYKENIYLSPEYIAGLEEMCKNNENLRKSWLEGSWDVVGGGAFDDLWRKEVHVLPRFKIPLGWHLDRTFDWASSQPFSVGWWAEANGEEAIIERNGQRYWFCPPRGTLIRINEWYGSEKLGSNKGLKLGAKAIALGIKEREAKMLDEGWIGEPVSPGPADRQISNVTEDDTDTIEKKMGDQGIWWTEADKSPGSRKIGFDLARDMLTASREQEGAGLYCTENCKAFIKFLPTLPRDVDDEDDIDTEAEDHVWDDTRFRVLKGSNRMATSLPVSWRRSA
jgi:hypothetical protein